MAVSNRKKRRTSKKKKAQLKGLKGVMVTLLTILILLPGGYIVGAIPAAWVDALEAVVPARAAGAFGTARGVADQWRGTVTTFLREALSGATVPNASLEDLPAFREDVPWVEINGNVPYFTPEDTTTTTAFETYAQLDALGRCGVAYANVCQELMPTEERGAIGQVKPSGWQLAKYDNVDGKYLYNRCHLIGFQLAGENANEKNLITGTRYLNIEGMLPFENQVADYVKETGNHVLYRVTPLYDGADLVAKGVLMEGRSVEDGGAGVSYCVYAYNAQPGVAIDYATGSSWADAAVGAISHEREKEE